MWAAHVESPPTGFLRLPFSLLRPPSEDLRQVSVLRSQLSVRVSAGRLCLLLKWGQTNPQSSGESQGGSQQTAAPYLGKSKLPEMFLGFGRRLQGPALTGGSARVCRCSRAPELVSSLELGEIPKRPSPPVFQAKVSERPLPARLPQAHARERRSDRQKQHEALSLN